MEISQAYKSLTDPGLHSKHSSLNQGPFFGPQNSKRDPNLKVPGFLFKLSGLGSYDGFGFRL